MGEKWDGDGVVIGMGWGWEPQHPGAQRGALVLCPKCPLHLRVHQVDAAGDAAQDGAAGPAVLLHPQHFQQLLADFPVQNLLHGQPCEQAGSRGRTGAQRGSRGEPKFRLGFTSRRRGN